ncbi:alpha/beta hydrolase [Actinoallomurus purpureus]|uniref:alpha/beta hydrolase n=1 Tax=Actinoallomurus purpureus TaxID=478114 RepID=UPI00209330D7|nr:alpha/beta hydrolase [Actinoallomurus purpureus]MCO6010031.1 alpha/beta hydrolase [Actinoallomurus purpureus]
MTSYDDLTVGVADIVAPSRQARALASALRVGWRPMADRLSGRFVSLTVLRMALEHSTRLLRPHPGVRIEELTRTGSSGAPITGEWVRPPAPHAGAILYLHGGGYAFCSPRTHRTLTSRLAAGTGLPVLVPSYRLAPEHPFPAAFEDAMEAYRWLLTALPPSRIVIAGDSSGGHLAAALVGEACRSGLPAPGGVVLFSPWVDLSCELSVLSDRENRDPFISPALARHFGRLYVGDHDDWSDPRLSLLDCTGLDLPPFLIQVAEQEVLRGEAERLAEALTESGNSCELQVWPGQIHVFQLFDRLFPEARAAVRDASAFIRAAVGADTTEEAA